MPSQVKVSVSKESVDTKVGISFRQELCIDETGKSNDDDVIVVNNILPNSLFANSKLEVDMRVLRINDVDASELDLGSAMKLLREAEDVITISAECVKPPSIPEKMTAPAPEQAAASAPEQAAAPAPEQAAAPAPEPATCSPPEQVAASVVSSVLQGESSPTYHSHEVTPAVHKKPAGMTTYEVTAYKPSVSATVGVAIFMREGVGILINSIASDSIFANMGLRAEMQILEINGTDCSNLEAAEAIGLLRNAVGSITIVAMELPYYHIEESRTTVSISRGEQHVPQPRLVTPSAVPRQLPTDVAARLQRVLTFHSEKPYTAPTMIAPSVYFVSCGDLCANIWCGVCAQYYAFEFDFSIPQQVAIKSAVPCGGFWGGIIGVSLNRKEKENIQRIVAQEFAEYNVYFR